MAADSFSKPVLSEGSNECAVEIASCRGVVVVVVLVPVVPPDEDATVVVTVPFGLVLTTLAEVKLPAESIEYCAVPVPPPQAVNIKETLVATQSDRARIVSLLHVNWFTKIFSID
jgi:hypothetical protein